MDDARDEPRNPYLTVDALLLRGREVLVIERKHDPLGMALPGGFVDYGESTESAVRREVREEAGVRFPSPRLFNVYSDPGRDPRQHTVTVCYWGEFTGEPVSGSDASAVRSMSLDDIDRMELVFDHGRIVRDFRRFLDEDWNPIGREARP